jgi:hypothetical protein
MLRTRDGIAKYFIPCPTFPFMKSSFALTKAMVRVLHQRFKNSAKTEQEPHGQEWHTNAVRLVEEFSLVARDGRRTRWQRLLIESSRSNPNNGVLSVDGSHTVNNKQSPSKQCNYRTGKYKIGHPVLCDRWKVY